MTPLQKLPKNLGDLGKLIVAKSLKTCQKSNKSPNLVTLVGAEDAATSTDVHKKLLLCLCDSIMDLTVQQNSQLIEHLIEPLCAPEHTCVEKTALGR